MINTYKCKGCGAPIEFDGDSGQLVCEFCGTHMSVDEVEKIQKSREFKVEGKETELNEKMDVESYKCQSCGAVLIVDENTSATVCGYCGSSAILKNRLDGELMPSKVIPFTMDKEKALQTFKNWTKKGIFTPNMFKEKSLADSITGIYVPFWLYDYDGENQFEAHCTRVRTETSGEYRYVHTDHYVVSRDGEASYDLVPADASEKMDDKMMDLLEPYDYSKMKDFKMPYLSGYLSEKYSCSKEDTEPRVSKKVREFIEDEVRRTVLGYTSVNVIRNDTHLIRKNIVYALFPVWILNYRYNGKQDILAINGQSGKQVGTLPVSNKKKIGWFGGITAVLFTLLMILGGLAG